MPSSASGKTHANTIQLIAMELTIAFSAVCFGRSGHCLELGRIHLALNAVGRLHVSRRDNREAKHTFAPLWFTPNPQFALLPFIRRYGQNPPIRF